MHQPSPPEGFSTPANCAACRWSIRQGSQSFYLASLLLPVAIREPAYAVYAFCRAADDLIDREQGGRRMLATQGYHVHAALTMRELLEILVLHGRLTASLRDEVLSSLNLRQS